MVQSHHAQAPGLHDATAMAQEGWRSAAVHASVLATGVALVALIWVYAWARGNTTSSDAEHERLIVSAIICCALLGAPIVLAGLAGEHTPILTVPLAAAGGAFTATAAAAASTLLIAMAISPATDHGDFGRPLFPWSYAGAIVLSVSLGVAAAWSVSARNGVRSSAAAALLVLFLITAAFGYLARGSSELNQCVVDDEFPLATDHVCSGY
jgi:hypothetical protein